MKRREPTLDFTSLLDVTLIILFFFLLFSRMETAGQTAAAAKQAAEAQALADRAAAQMQEAQALIDQLADALAKVESADARRAADLEAMLAFDRGRSLKLLLDVRDDSRSLILLRGDTLLATLPCTADLEQALPAAIREAGCDPADTLFCQLIVDGSRPGSASAYRAVSRAMAAVRETYCYLYYSETDVSIIMED